MWTRTVRSPRIGTVLGVWSVLTRTEGTLECGCGRFTPKGVEGILSASTRRTRGNKVRDVSLWKLIQKSTHVTHAHPSESLQVGTRVSDVALGRVQGRNTPSGVGHDLFILSTVDAVGSGLGAVTGHTAVDAPSHVLGTSTRPFLLVSHVQL